VQVKQIFHVSCGFGNGEHYERPFVVVHRNIILFEHLRFATTLKVSCKIRHGSLV